MIDYNKFSKVFLCSFICSVIIYGYELTHFTLSIDEEFFDNFYQTVSLGRWGHAFLRWYILPEPFAPFFTTLVSLLFFSLSTTLVTYIYNLNTKDSCIMAALCMSVPQFAYQLDFANQSDTVSIGMLLSVLSALAFVKYADKGIIKGCVLSIVAYVFSISIYQSLAILPITIILGWCLYSVLERNASNAYIIKRLISFACISFASVIIYSILTLLIQNITGAHATSYASSMFKWSRGFDKALFDTLAAIKSYFTFSAYYGLGVYSLVIIPFFSILIKSIKDKKYAMLPSSIFLLVALMLSPFFMLAVFGFNQPPRTMTSLGFSFALISIIAVRYIKSDLLKVLLPVILVIYSCSIASQLFHSDFMSEQSDRYYAGRVMSDLYRKYPDFNPKLTPVYFYGMINKKNPWKMPNSDIFGESFFSWDGGNNARMIAYIRMSGIDDLKRLDKTRVKEAREYASSMDVWPKEGSIVRKNGIMVVKLGNNPGIN